MTFQQLKYVIKIVETGSISAAAKELYVSQPSLSKAVMELEYELNTTLFIREKTGIKLTEDGAKFLIRARQVMDQMDLLEREFSEPDSDKKVFSVASQHYNFVLSAFSKVVKEFGGADYEFSLKELPTSQVIEEVKSGLSEIGIIYMSKFNHEIMKKTLRNEGLDYKIMFRAEPHVCISRSNRLSEKEIITFDDLVDIPRIRYDQKLDDSFFFYEELYSDFSSSKDIIVTDKASLVYLLNELDAYTISTANLSKNLEYAGAVTIPLDCDEYMDIAYIHLAGRPVSEVGKRLIELAVI